MFRVPRSVGVVVLGGLGGGLAAFLFLVDQPWRHPSEFMESPAALLWLLTVIAQGALWFLVTRMIYESLATLFRDATRRDKAETVLILAALALLSIITLVLPTLDWKWPFASIPEYPLTNRDLKIAVLYFVGLGFGLLPVSGMSLVRAKAQRFPAFSSGRKPKREEIQSYLALRDELQGFLAVAGAIVFTATLSVGALRNAIIAYSERLGDAFPAEYVVVYGIYFSLLLLAVYAPAYAALVRVGSEMRDAFLEIPETPSQAEVRGWHERREALTKVFALDVGITASFRAGAFIFAPLVGALVALLLPGVSL